MVEASESTSLWQSCLAHVRIIHDMLAKGRALSLFLSLSRWCDRFDVLPVALLNDVNVPSALP